MEQETRGTLAGAMKKLNDARNEAAKHRETTGTESTMHYFYSGYIKACDEALRVVAEQDKVSA